MNGNIKVKKLVSLNPVRYKKISLKEASTQHARYILSCNQSPYNNLSYKPLLSWLETEI